MCNKHPDREATIICNTNPCKELGLCAKCENEHKKFVHSETADLISEKEQFINWIKNKLELIKIKRKKYNIYHTGNANEFSAEVCKKLDTYVSEINSNIGKLAKIKPCKENDYEKNSFIEKEQSLSKEIKSAYFALKKLITKLLQCSFFTSMTNSESKILPFYYFKSNILTLVNIKDHIGYNFCTNFKNHNELSVIISAKSVYFIGVYEDYTMPTYKISLEDPSFKYVKLSNMKKCKYSSNVVQIQNKYIYAISGKSIEHLINHFITDCQCYDISKDKWNTISPLNIERASSGISTFNSRYIYIYGGIRSNEFEANDFEVYDILDDEKGWELLKTTNFNIELSSCSSAFICQISNKLLFLFNNSEYCFIEPESSGCLKNVDNFGIIFENWRVQSSALLWKGKVYFKNLYDPHYKLWYYHTVDNKTNHFEIQIRNAKYI